jgi:hypothetical protein
MIWFALIIPVLVSIFLYAAYKHKTLWWEFIIPVIISVIAIFFSKLGVEKIGISDKEYWGSWAVNIVYLEEWDEWITQTCSRTTTDSKGNTHTEWYDCSHRDYHPPEWYIIDSANTEINISQKEYERIAKLWGNQVFVELNRHYYRIDGDKYQCGFNYKTSPEDHLIPVTTIHNYENRVQAATSVYKFRDISEEDIKRYALKEYPSIEDYSCSSILGGVYPGVRKKLDYFNARYGALKELRVWLLIFRDQPIESGILQENYWKGSNKNEFVICIGLDKANNFQWSHVFSWTPAKETVIETRNYLYDNFKRMNPEDLESFVDYCTQNLLVKFKRREFQEFSYLTVNPPIWAVIMVYLLVLGINIGLSFWIIKNEFKERINKR